MPRKKVRSTRVQTRLTPDILKVVRRAAEIEGVSVSGFIAAAARQVAYDKIKEAHVIRISIEDQRAFFDALLNPPEPGPAMRKAFEAHRRLIKQS